MSDNPTEFRFGSKADEEFSIYMDLWGTDDLQTVKFSFKNGLTNDEIQNELMPRVNALVAKYMNEPYNYSEPLARQYGYAQVLNGRVFHPNVLLQELELRARTLAARVAALEAANSSAS